MLYTRDHGIKVGGLCLRWERRVLPTVLPNVLKFIGQVLEPIAKGDDKFFDNSTVTSID